MTPKSRSLPKAPQGRIGSAAWLDAMKRMSSRARGRMADLISYHLFSFHLGNVRQLMGGCLARKSALWQKATRELTALAVKRGYWRR